MVHNQTISTAVPADLTESLQQTLSIGRLRRFEEAFGLPSTVTSFLWLTLAVVLVCAGLVLLVMTSVQSFQTRRQIATLEAQFRATERENAELVWQIAQYTSLASVRQRALTLGYEAPTLRHFVTLATPSNVQANVHSTIDPLVYDEQLLIDQQTTMYTDPWQWLGEQFNSIRNWW